MGASRSSGLLATAEPSAGSRREQSECVRSEELVYSLVIREALRFYLLLVASNSTRFRRRRGLRLPALGAQGGAAVMSAAAGPVAAAPGADTTRVPRKRSVTWSVTVTPRTRVDAVIVAPPRRCARSGRSFTQER